jgi:hypothetical protein
MIDKYELILRPYTETRERKILFLFKVKMEQPMYEVMNTVHYKRIDGTTFTVKAGTRTDLQTVPWWATSLWPQSGSLNYAAVGHDDEYIKHRGIKLICDINFLVWAILSGANPKRAVTAFFFIVFFGFKQWNKYAA